MVYIVDRGRMRCCLDAPECLCKGSIADQLAAKGDTAYISSGALQGCKDSCQAGNGATRTVAYRGDAPRGDPPCKMRCKVGNTSKVTSWALCKLYMWA